ncbi:MAG TPA: prolyl oligopeptidase family serine peptidase [Gemmatimonadaceae bacterium]|nr:prolyl oligopeptidase family serine peptidase [Gemmatimonadaceae bacterium]
MAFSFRRMSTRALGLSTALAIAVAPGARAQQNGADNNGKEELPPKERLAAETYVKPPAAIERLVTAPRENNVTLNNQSPNRKFFLKLQSDGMPSVQTFGKPHYYFAGLQVDFKANRARVLTTRGSSGLEIIDASTGKSHTIETPNGASVSSPQWSPDGSKIAYIANFDDASRLYVADVASGKSRQLSPRALLATLVTTVDWTADGTQLVTVLIPDARKAEPKRPAIEPGPLVRLTDEKKEKTRNFASLLRDPFEKELMEYYVTGQLATIAVSNGAVRKIGAPAMISAVDASPDGKYFHVTLMQKPFSYIVQYNSFGTSDQIWDTDGKTVTVVATRPLREVASPDDDFFGPVGAGANDSLPRNVAWMPNGQGIYFLQQDPAPARGAGAAADTTDSSGQPGQGRARRKDHLYQWTPPFDASSKKVLLESDNRIGGVLFTDDGKAVFAAENANGTGHVYAVYFDEPGKKYTIWRVRGLNATVTATRGFGGGGRGGNGADSLTFYQNPGTIVAKRGRNGGQVAQLSSDGKYAFLEGTRYFKTWQDSAPHGFVDKVEIKTGQKSRVFEGQADMYETVTAALDDDFSRFVVSRESRTQVPDSYLRDGASGQYTKLTNNKDYTPEFTAAVRKRIPVTRADGHHFMVNLTLPSDYRPGTRLPAMFWFYPFEFTDQGGYDRTQRANNINQFPQAGPRTIEYLVTQGYAVANFDPPIIGANGRMNDNYVNDLVANLTAVLDELDRQGFIDRSRVGIGGHSYGAFSTVNAMVNTPFFKAGIAGDGMYNRSLTPNGFQFERRDFWEGQKTYVDMSPFFKADKLSGALLMYHSIEDQNVGTDPISSIRMMHALQGLGKVASLYMYPYEDHGPATKETILDQWARWTAWLDLYVKNAGQPKEKVASE